jgi:uncharacterized protein YkwD
MKALTFGVVAIIMATVVGLSTTGTIEAAKAPPPAQQSASESALSSWEQQVLNLHNQARSKRGISALTTTDSLAQAADVRCTEIKNNFSHTRPSGRAWYTVFKDFGISYRVAGENIARGQSSPTAVHNAWMSSSGHRANILNSSFRQAGVGHCTKNGSNYWVVLFKG